MAGGRTDDRRAGAGAAGRHGAAGAALPTHRTRGLWGFPGGRLEAGRDAGRAAARELLEETGVVAEFSRALDVFDMIRRDASGDLAFHYVLVAMQGIWRDGEPKASSELLDVAWMNLRMIARVPSSTETIRLSKLLFAAAPG